MVKWMLIGTGIAFGEEWKEFLTTWQFAIDASK